VHTLTLNITLRIMACANASKNAMLNESFIICFFKYWGF
jgi:hypothetical protein